MIDLTKSPEKLKSSILEDAMQGKLTKQLPDDGNVDDLLDAIRQEKEALIKAKKIKNSKPLPDITPDEIPFDIPKNWRWVRLGDISYANSGHNLNNYICDEGNVLYVKVSDMNLPENQEEIKTSNNKINKETYLVPKKSIIFPKIGGAIKTNKRRFIFSKKVSIDSNTMSLTPIKSSLFQYLFMYMKQKDLSKIQSGTSMPSINKKKVENITIPLPPLPEQKRIVEKLDKLLPEVEQFSKSVNELDTLRNDFPVILKNSLLQSAMMGKLTKQLPDDGNVDDLLDAIRQEKEALIKAKKIKKSKPLPDITPDEIPFDIPNSWRWVRLGDISTLPQQKSINPQKINNNTWVLDLQEIEKNTGKLISKKYNYEKNAKSSKNIFHKEDILYNKLRPYLNKVLVADEDGVSTSELIVIHLIKDINPFYISIALRSPYFLSKVNADTYGTKMPRAGLKNVIKYLVPLPPLDEQKRIVEKLDKLFKELKD
ncbi:restriction endonuclease subunit S [Apilactobacillus xinyiensis]|uniref:restriction endonuclease subunit S n=1 Tax=Apilactobacillus xinyiensis TaxID=2841032 RepID=UPI002010007B|nr:restriction endonuclease subunit S [Apilactobacillus xinyiensis]MCL0318592.1 restriction endonuclease subunit S [Apilactobacillus xinyiensis]